MKSPLLALTLLLVAGLTACHKQTVPAQADMDAATRQKAVEVREAADKETAEMKAAAFTKEAARKEAAVQEALAAEPAPQK